MLSVTHVVAPVSVAAFAFVLLRVAFSWWVHGAKHRAERARLPPGPRAIPFLGNVHQLPMDYQERTFAEWAKQYGAQYYILIIRDIARTRAWVRAWVGVGEGDGRPPLQLLRPSPRRPPRADLEGGVLSWLSV